MGSATFVQANTWYRLTVYDPEKPRDRPGHLQERAERHRHQRFPTCCLLPDTSRRPTLNGLTLMAKLTSSGVAERSSERQRRPAAEAGRTKSCCRTAASPNDKGLRAGVGGRHGRALVALPTLNPGVIATPKLQGEARAIRARRERQQMPPDSRRLTWQPASFMGRQSSMSRNAEPSRSVVAGSTCAPRPALHRATATSRGLPRAEICRGRDRGRRVVILDRRKSPPHPPSTHVPAGCTRRRSGHWRYRLWDRGKPTVSL